MEIIKCELLWSRSCKLKCSYCNMVNEQKNTPSVGQWTEGFVNLKKLGCAFLAIYGAEPLEEFDKLPQAIYSAENMGIHTTVITSGITDNRNEKLRILYGYGLRSITTSYDFNPTDRYSRIKTDNALSVIDTFRSFGPVRDSAVVVTLTRENYRYLPEIIKRMSDKNIWTFFDLIHPDRGQPGAKVKNTHLDLLFTKEDFSELMDVLNHVLILKEKGLLCHASRSFIDMIQKKIPLYKPYNWICAEEQVFPSWVTVDCSGGIVRPCDDFYMKDVVDIPVWDLYARWDEFCTTWGVVVRNNCPGCMWNTHIDANRIKEGKILITDYVHGMEKNL